MRYLLDTNICIYLIKNRPHEVIGRFRQHSPGDVAISTITLFELQYGIEKANTGSSRNMLSLNFFSP